MQELVLESCHSIWVFELDRMHFSRVVKGIRVLHSPVSTHSRPYSFLEIDPMSAAFTVYLNPDRTRMIRSWRHTGECTQCGGHKTTELSIDDLHDAIRA